MRSISSIGLQQYLLGLIFIIATLCLLSTAVYILYQGHIEFQHELSKKADTLDKHLQLQLILIKAGYKANQHFPNLSPVHNQDYQGLCLQYTATDDSIERNSCYGGLVAEKNWPLWFEKLYSWSFNPSNKLVRLITYNHNPHGKLTLTPDPEIEINRAWHILKKLLGLYTVTLSSLCVSLYFFLGRALKPADMIISDLKNITQGDLSTRLPTFNISEWQRMAKAINHLSASLEKSINDQNQLTLKLMSVREEERRFLTRELHDEFGQCLAGMQATAFSMLQTTKEKYQELVGDCQNIADINSLMMEHLRHLLQQLNLSNIDELGLTASLKSMISNWNAHSGKKTKYVIKLDADIDQIPIIISNQLFRIIQEALTNVAKHSQAKNAKVKLEIIPSSISNITNSSTTDMINLTISDDGIANNMMLEYSKGIGLLGIRERVMALGGTIRFSTNQPSGLIIQVGIPIQIPFKS
ncbi:MAG: histidine kinase [Methylococcaceae bacterium]|nr:histidine kinase [Methylococcaceae bacterium]